MAVKLFFLILPLFVSSFDFNILAIKRNVGVSQKVLSDIQNGRFIGCKYQEVCPIDRSCYNDRLFGSCLSELDSHDFIFELSPEVTQMLEKSMGELWQSRYSWSDFFTQCCLQSIIRSSELQTTLDVSYCKEAQVRLDKRGEEDAEMVNIDDSLLRRLYEQEIYASRLKTLLEGGEGRAEKRNNEEGINPKSNSNDAVSKTKVISVDPEIIRKTLKVAKRPSDEWIRLTFDKTTSKLDGKAIIKGIASSLKIPEKIKIDYQIIPEVSTIYFKLPHQVYMPASNVTQYFSEHRDAIKGYTISDIGVNRISNIVEEPIPRNANFGVTLIICTVVLFGVLLVLLCFCIQKFRYKRDKMGDIIGSRFTDSSASNYKDLFRVSNNKESASLKSKQGVSRIVNKPHSGDTPAASSPVSTRSSTSSWTDDIPSATNMDIYTGHMILSYMEKHLKNRDMFQSEWNSIRSYETEDSKADIAVKPENVAKNRYEDKIPYDKSRVVLKSPKNGDYINASLIVDSDPRLPAYIAAQSPIESTITDFWQMIWEQGVVVIINLTEMDEKDIVKYWPKEGSEIYGIYEINLVSEHIWSDEYLVRNFYLKNLENAETKTVTQFHFFSWPLDKLPSSSRSILEFRRKVNKSYRSKSTPILVHCKDGCGRSGTYILLDLILNRVGKGLKEMDIAATLEHLRDQRMHLVNTEEQFGFVLNTISEEVNNILKVLNQ